MIALTREVGPVWAARDEAGRDTNNACFASGWYEHLLDRVSRMYQYIYDLII